jgi:hypothetical protein
LERARALGQVGFVAGVIGEMGRARAAADEARAIYEAAGDRGGVAISFFALGAAALDWREGVASFHEASRRFAAIGNRRGEVLSLHNVANYELEMGDARDAALDAAAFEAAKARVALDPTDDREEMQRRLRYESGDPQSTLASYAAMWSAKTKQGVDLAWEGEYYANVLQALDRLDEAHAVYDESVRGLGELGMITVYVEAARDLARLDLLEGRVADAETLARTAVQRARATGTVYFVAFVQPALAWAHALEGRTAEATREMAEVLALPDYGDVLAPLNVAQAALVVDERAGRDPAAAVARLEKIAARAQSLGNVEAALEARLALAQHTLRAGDTKAAQRLLGAIEDEARARGLAFLARRAHESGR